MMHFGLPEEGLDYFYLSSMKGDPKTVHITHHPAVSLLFFRQPTDFPSAREVEVTGRAYIIRDEEERRKALNALAARSPVVSYMLQTGNAHLLDCIKVIPQEIKYRIAGEIVQGVPPTVIEFPENRQRASDWEVLRRRLRNWHLALRIPFLAATVVPILLGAAVAWAHRGTLGWGWLLLTLLAGLFLHAGTNVVNDYFDHRSGNDPVNREFVRPFSGGSRVIQMGLLSPLEVLIGGLLLFLLGAILGLFLAVERGWFILILGVFGILSGLFYVSRPFNWAGRGIGELMVGLNFGPLMALGSYYVQTQSFSWAPVVAAVPVALLIAAVLYINEFPDYEADKAVGKNTLVVRLGRRRAALGFAFLMALVYTALAAGVLSRSLPWLALLALLTIPLAVRSTLYALRYHSQPVDLVPANVFTVLNHIATGMLLALAFVWEGLGWAYAVPVALVAAAYLAYQYWDVERQRRAFLGLRQALRA